jgi:phage baseplate assembly protein V
MKDPIRRLLTKLQASITRGILKLVDDEKPTQTIQVELRFHEIADAIEHFQPFGVSFNPTKDSEVLVLAIGSSQDNLVALNATDRSIRPTSIQEGEGGLYTPSGWKVFCNEDDEVHLSVKAASQSFMRGEEVKSALETYAGSVKDAVAKIKVANHVIENVDALAALTAAKTKLASDVQAALSEKVKGE